MAEMEASSSPIPSAYVGALRTLAPREGLVRIDADTVMSPGHLRGRVRAAAGGAVQAVDEVMTGEAPTPSSAMRPPGHHAERTPRHGVLLLQQRRDRRPPRAAAHGAERVAIVDWDVHHGNGTQDIFWGDPTRAVLPRPTRCRSIPAPAPPGSAASTAPSSTRRCGRATAATVFREALETGDAAARSRRSRPISSSISAGFDAHWRDPLANLNLIEADFGWATRKLMEIADARCGGRIVSVLEGGYDLEGVANSVAAHVDALMGAATRRARFRRCGTRRVRGDRGAERRDD